MDNQILIKNANKTIQIVSQCLVEDLAMQKAFEPAHEDLASAFQLRALVLFAQLELTSIFKAMLCTEHVCAKRYHNKNLKAYASECYKMLYHYGKARKRSVWGKFEKIVKAGRDDAQMQQYTDISNQLDVFGNTQIDKPLRDATMHYDEDMSAVYNITVALKSEDDAAKFYCDFTDILRQMQILVTEIINKQTQSITASPKVTIKNHLLGDEKCKEIWKDTQLKESVELVLSRAPQELDKVARIKSSLENTVVRLKAMMVPSIVSDSDSVFDELRVPIDLSNVQMLLRQTFIDVVVICESFYNSINTMEAALNLRRLVVHQAAMMALLYGYEANEQANSQWQKIVPLVPQSLIGQMVAVEEWMKILLPHIDKSKRHSFVHLYDDKGNVRLAEFVDSMEVMDFQYELGVSNGVVQLYGLLMPFLTDLMNEIATKKHQETEESTQRVNAMLDSIIDVFKQAPLEEDKKVNGVAKIEEIKKRLAQF